MEAAVLASGSKGNATYVEMDGVRLLIDAGISATRIKKALAAIGTDAAALDAILLTHEHRDHIAGLATMSKWYHLPIFTRPGTIAGLKGKVAVPEDELHAVSDAFSFDGLHILPFSTSHDAADPCGFRICGSKCCTLATDLGFVTQNVQEAVDGADVAILEANHDLDMLKNGRYPWPLKRRILSNRGHLTNADAAWALVRMQARPKHVVLAHLSEENNRPELAQETVSDILHGQGVAVEDLQLASQHETVRIRQ